MAVKSQENKQLAGTIYGIGSLRVAEMIFRSGFDWVMIDMEHSALTLDDVQDSLPVFGEKMLKIVRVPCNDETWIKQVLDTGCDGIMVPMIKTRADAVFIGPYDLSASMGLAGQVAHPDVLEAISKVKEKCRASGMPYGFFGSQPEALAGEARDGCRYLLCGIDNVIFSTALKDLSDRLHDIIL